MLLSSGSGSDCIGLEAVCCNRVGTVRAPVCMKCRSIWMTGSLKEAIFKITGMEAAEVKVMGVRVSCLVSMPFMAGGDTTKRDDFSQGVGGNPRKWLGDEERGEDRLIDGTASSLG